MFDWSLRTIGFIIITFITIVLTLVFEFLRPQIPIPLWIIILIGLIVLYLVLTLIKKDGEIKNLSTINTKPDFKPNSKKKSIPNEFEIGKIETERYQWSVTVSRSWYPTTKPDVDLFTSNIKFTVPICKFCKSDLLEVFRRVVGGKYHYLGCPDENCDSNKIEPDSPDGLERIRINQLKIFKGLVRKDFNKYWNKYVKKYDDFTKKKYDDFWSPI